MSDSEDALSAPKLAILVDGSSFIYRAYYALPQLTLGSGESVGAVYGFCSMLISLIDKHRSDVFCVALDSGRNTFRTEIYKEYKSNREEAPEDLKAQFPILSKACAAFGILTVEKAGFEADDLIATYAEKLSNLGYEVRIIASDKDLMQLINDKISLFDPIKSKIIKADEVFDKYHVLPSQMTLLQALMGDASDNIPGITGIGQKTAAKLINEFKTLEGIYKNIHTIKLNKIRENLINQKEILDISLKLVTLAKDVKIDENFDNLKVSFDNNRAIDFLSGYSFNSLIKRLNKRSIHIESKNRHRIKITSPQDLKNFFELNRAKRVSFFYSSCSNETGMLAISCNSHIAYCIFSLTEEADLFTQNICFKEMSSTLKSYFENPNIIKIGIRNGSRFFRNIKFESYDDLSVMAYLLYGIIPDTVGDLFKNSDDPICKISFRDICDIDRICKISELIYDNYDNMLDELNNAGLLQIYQQIDCPLISILKHMEEVGITISPKTLNDLAEVLLKKIKNIEKEVFIHSGCEFNIGSVKQLSDILFNKLQIPLPKKKGSLGVENLEELAEINPIPALVIEWRKLSKLLSSYTHSLCKLINPATKRLHSTFNMTSTITGRLSSSNPNLQNIPHRTEHGQLIRQAFISAKGYKLVSFDYSQIELRILAHIANIKLLKEAFLTKKDVHALTAVNIFGVPLQEVTNEMRSHAKTINFGIIYGMSPFRLSGVLNISLEKANSYIKNYFAKLPEFATFKSASLEFARKNGYVQTILGRRCYIKDILSKNFQLRNFSERRALNAIIQGSASDIVKTAMINIYPELGKFHSSMLIQIHDELVFETRNDFVDRSIPIIKNVMENAIQLSVPLEVNAEFGDYLK